MKRLFLLVLFDVVNDENYKNIEIFHQNLTFSFDMCMINISSKLIIVHNKNALDNVYSKTQTSETTDYNDILYTVHKHVYKFVYVHPFRAIHIIKWRNGLLPCFLSSANMRGMSNICGV